MTDYKLPDEWIVAWEIARDKGNRWSRFQELTGASVRDLGNAGWLCGGSETAGYLSFLSNALDRAVEEKKTKNK